MKRSLLLLLLAGPALAQEKPRVLPMRDVTIVYHLSGDASLAVPGLRAADVRLSWSAGEQRLRVEPEGHQQVLLVDLADGTVQALDPNLRAAVALPVKPGDLQNLKLEGAHFARRGRAAVAGLSCAEYEVDSRRGHGTICLTDDGVALRGSGEVNGRSGSFTATQVGYDAVSPSLFRVPPGYAQIAIPRLGRVP